MDLLTIYDPELQVGAIIDLEQREAFGPVMVGPQAKQLLDLFIESVPFDMTRMLPSDRANAFASFLERMAVAAPPPPAAAHTDQVEPVAGDTVDTGTAGAEAEAHTSGTVPPPAPADTDTQAGAGTPPALVPCVNCQGTGSVTNEPGSPPTTCGLCNGTGRTPAPPAPAAPAQQ